MSDELPLVFACAGEQLVGVLSRPQRVQRVGVLLLVGGDQYRVGSHRQFALLARALAAQGYASLRFDYRGMGDSSGEPVAFDELGPDLAAASEQLFSNCPGVDRVVLFGLCDAASSALIFAASLGARLAGLCLLNPWVRSEQSLAVAQVRHYYRERFLSRSFWAKLFGGRLRWRESLREYLRQLKRALRSGRESVPDDSFQARMLRGIEQFSGPLLLILSADDLTAREFDDCARASRRWSAALGREQVSRRDLAQADHTFSSASARRAVESELLRWLSESVA
ncbi:MAG: hydrolase 1, exosortase system-associated [Proteobacteria bacterium]|nr:hydrolase 1, exosortase system-associated [Pseudomonadota bacterium]